jgi:transcriptional regulator with XRE-family HTH domain
VDTDRHPQLKRNLAIEWGLRLRARREALGLSQTQLARIADMTQQAVWQFETGKRIPLDRTKVALARALGTTPGDLFPWPPMEDLIGGAA